MNCRDYTAEFEERRPVLSEAAQTHRRDCPECEKTSGAQTRVWQMIEELKRIDAPHDFDFRVKAKIADFQPKAFQPRFFPVLRYVLPLGVFALLFGLVALNTDYFSNSENAVPQTAQIGAPQNPFERDVRAINSFSGNQTAVGGASDAIFAANAADAALPESNDDDKRIAAIDSAQKSPPRDAKKNTGNTRKEAGGGSRDLALTNSSAKYPTGFDPNRKIPTATGNDAKPATDEQILDFYGIEIVSENGSRKVRAVRQNTAAERAGIKVGDTIEAIDGEKLSAAPIHTKKFEFKRLTIIRGTEIKEISLPK